MMIIADLQKELKDSGYTVLGEIENDDLVLITSNKKGIVLFFQYYKKENIFSASTSSVNYGVHNTLKELLSRVDNVIFNNV